MYMDEMYGYDNRANFNCGFAPMNMEQFPMMNEPMMQMGARPLETLYPEIYRLTYPMVVRACDNLKFMGGPNIIITGNMIEDMVINIYDSINTEDERSEEGDDEKRNDDELRQFHRINFRDFIRVLLIRELLRRGHTHFHPRWPVGGQWQDFGRPY